MMAVVGRNMSFGSLWWLVILDYVFLFRCYKNYFALLSALYSIDIIFFFF